MVIPLPKNPLSDFVAPRRNALMGLASGLLQGNDLGQGLGMGFERAAEGRRYDDAYATAEKEKADRQNQINQTVQYLRQQPGGATWADRVESGVVDSPTAFNGWLESTKSNPDPKAEADAQQQLFGREKDLAAQYAQQDPVKTYQLVKGGYERVRQSAAADSGAGDVGLVYGFMKMLDPGSVVREGEFATAESTAGIPQQIVGLYNKALSGERLTPEQRQQFVALADQLYQESAANLSETNAQFGSRADPWGVDASRFAVQPETFQPMQAPKSPQNWIDAGGGYKVRPQ